jgi:peptidylprolyl isomerase
VRPCKYVSVCALVALFVIAVAACGSSKSSVSASDAATTTPTSGAAGTSPCAQTTKPHVSVPKTPAPTTLVVKDLKPGSGAAVKAGDNITVNYVGVHYTDGTQFDASWDRNQALPLQIGVGGVIPGWDQGLIGMKVCGERELIIPSALAYGTQGSSDGSIKPGETLVFVVDLVSIP